MTERRAIDSRLANWARWARARQSPRPDERRRIDADDARLLEQHMPLLRTFDRLLLWWCYVDQVTAAEVCRRLRIEREPAVYFVGVVAVAQEAIDREVTISASKLRDTPTFRLS